MTVGLVRVLVGLGLLMSKVWIFESSDFITDLDDFFVQTVLFEDGFLDYLCKNGIGLDKFEGLVFEINGWIGGIEILNIRDFELGLG